ncbi:DUF1127 domain-containing protein [Acidocella sp.]|uniref:DUF1127 domain-containing protein n=1 Tax=Acidocella sp. TaxID=50710 RepID=UPI003CFE3E4C
MTGIRLVRLPSLTGGVKMMVSHLMLMRQAIRGRRDIARMDARMLADIGMSRADAEEEIRRRPWDVAPRPYEGPRED